MALEGSFFQEQRQNELALATAATTHQMLDEAYTSEQAAAVGRNAMAETSTMADGMIAQSPNPPPACRAGCAHCCRPDGRCHRYARANAAPTFMLATLTRPGRGRGA